MIYFDNAATTFYKPREVAETVLETITRYSVNPNRSFNALTTALSEKILATRRKIAELVNLKNPLNAVFGLNCTDALNLAILGSVRSKGENIVTSALEHNSVMRPLHRLQEKVFIKLSIIKPDEKLSISPQAIDAAITPNTSMVVLSHVSNVTGATIDALQIGQVCKKRGVKFLLDAAQSIGYIPIDMEAYNVDMLAFPAHKGLHGIVGCGVLCFKDESAPKPVRFGGTGTQSHLLTQPTESPEAYESGTVNSPAILALGTAIDWWCANKNNMLKQMKLVQSTLVEGLSEINGVKIFSVANNSGIVAFKIKESDSAEVCDLLAKNYGIALRGGLHCAPLAHKFLGTSHSGLVRASVSGQNTLSEAYIFLNAIAQLSKQY